MDVSIGDRWEGFVETAVKSGRYASATDVVTEGLRLVEEREGKLQALRETLLPRLADGGESTLDEVRSSVGARLAQWEAGRTGES